MRTRTPLWTACCLCAAFPLRSPADDGSTTTPPVPAPQTRPVSAMAATAATPLTTPTSATTSTSADSAPIPIKHIVESGQSAGEPGEPAYHIDASWVISGYNDDEVIYSILIINQDTRVIRCTTLINGYYVDSGVRHSISDRQSVTLFPGKQQSAGTWVGMDQASGATYKVTCRAVS